ncbi:MAG: hypothetical protein JST85_07290 [Acidobacteria bacterium]|nr:hypothetical protein [Acidobacteriota bacterium]
MACCGQKRQALSKSVELTTSPILQSQTADSNLGIGRDQPGHIAVGSSQNTVLIRYLQGSPLYIRGAVTGRQYLFSAAQPVLAVDARDGDGFLKSRKIRRV